MPDRESSTGKVGLMRLVPVAKARQEEIKAMTREQVSTSLDSSQAASTAYERRHYSLFLLLARTGMRLGEALALRWDDVDFRGREIRVERTISAGRIETPKSGHGRSVDMSDQLAKHLLRLHVERKTETLKHGWPEVPSWLFCNDVGTPLDESKVRKVFAKTVKAAGLPPHFSPHSLRHTFASLLLQQGGEPGVRSASAWPREHRVDGRYVREVASDGQQSRGQSTGR